MGWKCFLNWQLKENGNCSLLWHTWLYSENICRDSSSNLDVIGFIMLEQQPSALGNTSNKGEDLWFISYYFLIWFAVLGGKCSKILSPNNKIDLECQDLWS